MKIRNGFVSNSSSSSFLIYGVCISDSADDFEKNAEYNEDEDSISEILYNLNNDNAVEIEQPPEDEIYIGLSWDKVGDDETGKEFKARVQKEVRDFLEKAKYKGKIEFGTHAHAWRDG